MDLDYYMIKDGSGISITMTLKCVECGKTTKNLLQLYCDECGGLVEVMKSRKLLVKKSKKKRS